MTPVLLLLTDTDTQAVLKMPCASMNFYPGLIVLERLSREPAPSRPADA